MYVTSCPILRFDDVESIVLPRQPANFRVDVAGLQYDGFLNFREGTALIISLHGGIDREKLVLPVFARWNYAGFFKYPVLCLADPLLYLDPKIRIGWYVGDAERDATDVIVQIIRRVAAQLAIPEQRCIFYSSSGGGFASIVAASRMYRATAVVINPQTEINQFWSHSVDDLLRLFGTFTSIASAREAFPTRFSAIEAVLAGRTAKRAPRIIFAQNIQDTRHYQNHYKPFIAAVNGIVEGGTSEDGLTISLPFDCEGGHFKTPPGLDATLLQVLRDRNILSASPVGEAAGASVAT